MALQPARLLLLMWFVCLSSATCAASGPEAPGRIQRLKALINGVPAQGWVVAATRSDLHERGPQKLSQDDNAFLAMYDEVTREPLDEDERDVLVHAIKESLSFERAVREDLIVILDNSVGAGTTRLDVLLDMQKKLSKRQLVAPGGIARDAENIPVLVREVMWIAVPGEYRTRVIDVVSGQELASWDGCGSIGSAARVPWHIVQVPMSSAENGTIALRFEVMLIRGERIEPYTWTFEEREYRRVVPTCAAALDATDAAPDVREWFRTEVFSHARLQTLVGEGEKTKLHVSYDMPDDLEAWPQSLHSSEGSLGLEAKIELDGEVMSTAESNLRWRTPMELDEARCASCGFARRIVFEFPMAPEIVSRIHERQVFVTLRDSSPSAYRNPLCTKLQQVGEFRVPLFWQIVLPK